MLTDNVLIRINTTVPQITVAFCDRVFLVQSGQRILNVTTTGTLEGVVEQLHPGEIFSIRQGGNELQAATVTTFVHLGFPETFIASFISTIHLLHFLDQFGSEGTQRGCFLDFRTTCVYLFVVFGLCDLSFRIVQFPLFVILVPPMPPSSMLSYLTSKRTSYLGLHHQGIQDS